MARIRIPSKKNINSLTQKIPHRKIPTGIRMVGMPKKPLSIAYRRKEKDQILVNSKLTVRKRSGLQDVRELVNKLQTLKGTISKYLNLKVKWQTKQFNIIVDSRAIKNHITLKVIERLKIPYREKEKPYSLVTISGEPVLYKDGIINLKTGPI